MNPNITALNQLGQSVWIDSISRMALRSGELSRLVAEGVSGLTSNPTIFKQAIADTSDYDSDVRTLAAKGMTAEQICEDLMIGDVGSAADLLRPVPGAAGHGAEQGRGGAHTGTGRRGSDSR